MTGGDVARLRGPDRPGVARVVDQPARDVRRPDAIFAPLERERETRSERTLGRMIWALAFVVVACWALAVIAPGWVTVETERELTMRETAAAERAARETYARVEIAASEVERARIERDTERRRGLTAATQAGREREWLCVDAAGDTVAEAGAGGALWDVRQMCRQWGLMQ